MVRVDLGAGHLAHGGQISLPTPCTTPSAPQESGSSSSPESAPTASPRPGRPPNRVAPEPPPAPNHPQAPPGLEQCVAGGPPMGGDGGAGRAERRLTPGRGQQPPSSRRPRDPSAARGSPTPRTTPKSIAPPSRPVVRAAEARPEPPAPPPTRVPPSPLGDQLHRLPDPTTPGPKVDDTNHDRVVPPLHQKPRDVDEKSLLPRIPDRVRPAIHVVLPGQVTVDVDLGSVRDGAEGQVDLLRRGQGRRPKSLAVPAVPVVGAVTVLIPRQARVDQEPAAVVEPGCGPSPLKPEVAWPSARNRQRLDSSISGS